MKTSKSLSSQFATAITCLVLLVTTSLFITSCQKEELPNPGNSQTATESDRLTGPDLQPVHSSNHHYATVNTKQLNPPLETPSPSPFQIATVNAKQIGFPAHNFVFRSINIDHYAGVSNLPDYSISINQNGTAVYEGRKNVYIKSTRTLKITKEQLELINDITIKLADIATAPINVTEDERKPAMAFTRTTFAGNNKSSFWSLIDNNSQPKWLVNYRTQVEQVLKLSSLINIPGQIATVVE